MDAKKMKQDLLETGRKSAVELPADYWKIILELLDDLCEEKMKEMSGAPQRYLQMLQITDPQEINKLFHNQSPS